MRLSPPDSGIMVVLPPGSPIRTGFTTDLPNTRPSGRKGGRTSALSAKFSCRIRVKIVQSTPLASAACKRWAIYIFYETIHMYTIRSVDATKQFAHVLFRLKASRTCTSIGYWSIFAGSSTPAVLQHHASCNRKSKLQKEDMLDIRMRQLGISLATVPNP